MRSQEVPGRILQSVSVTMKKNSAPEKLSMEMKVFEETPFPENAISGKVHCTKPFAYILGIRLCSFTSSFASKKFFLKKWLALSVNIIFLAYANYVITILCGGHIGFIVKSANAENAAGLDVLRQEREREKEIQLKLFGCWAFSSFSVWASLFHSSSLEMTLVLVGKNVVSSAIACSVTSGLSVWLRQTCKSCSFDLFAIDLVVFPIRRIGPYVKDHVVFNLNIHYISARFLISLHSSLCA